MKPFEYLEHTADVKFRAYGETPEEMLSNAAAALFKTMVDPATISVKEAWKVALEASDLEDLAYLWLSEIVFLFETESAVFASFAVSLERCVDETWRLSGEIGGERIDLSRHAFENEVKAVTMHQFQIVKNDHWCLQAILDV
ncbi:Protein archease [uncultured archaeon]|nr:Protein archease [uncultured archaeon]